MDGSAKDRTITPAEARAAQALRTLLANQPRGELSVASDAMRSLAEYLERFFDEVLAEVHEEWKWESFDGIDVDQAAKLSECCLRLCGLAWLVSDQTLVPLLGQVQIHPEISQVTAAELRVGEPGPGGMVRTSPDQSSRARNTLQQLVHERRSSWSYVVGYGDFESSDCFESED